MILSTSITRCVFIRPFVSQGGLAAVMFLTVSGSMGAGVINARSAAQIDVLTAVALAKNGDTVAIPAGTAHWSSQFTLSKAITLAGAGIGKTIIYNDYRGGKWWNIQLVRGEHTRITGIEFLNGSGSAGGNITDGNFFIQGATKPNGGDFRLDHCKIYGMVGGPTIHTQTVLGVVDHCFITSGQGTIGYTYDGWFTGSNPAGLGDGSWAAPSDYGGFQYAFYYEDCVFGKLPGDGAVFFDGTHGGRAVVRHCYFKGGFKAVISHHGTESRHRSFRHFEWYDCIVEDPGSGTPLNQRGGTGVVFNNRFIGGPNGVDMGLLLTSDRPVDPTYWGRASGKNPWDENDANGGSNANPNAFYSGTCASGTTKTHIVVSGANWRSGQWLGFAVTNMTAPPNRSSISALSADLSKGSSVTGNGSNNIELEPTIFNSANLSFAPGDQFKIFKPKNTLDLLGRAGVDKSALISGVPARLQSTGQPGNNQVSEPWYGWDNKQLKSDRKTVVKNELQYRGSTSYIRQCTGSNNDECHYWNNGAVKPGYPWNPNATAVIGPDSSMGVPTMTATGDTTSRYPHPLVSGAAVPTPTPSPTPTPAPTPNPPTNLRVVPGA